MNSNRTTYKSALTDIKETISYKVEELDDCYPNVWHTTLYTCKDALELQVAKKPVNDEYCPNCGDNLVFELSYGAYLNLHWCTLCGQRIDWGDDEI